MADIPGTDVPKAGALQPIVARVEADRNRARADRELAEVARDEATAQRNLAEDARTAAEAASATAATLLTAVMAVGRAVYPTHADLPAPTASGDDVWVAAGPSGDEAPGVWKDLPGGWARGSVRLAAVDEFGNLLF